MWTVPHDRAKQEIGDKEVERLTLLRQWLYPHMTGRLEFRAAPSLIARSETELFGISMPRFAFRAYLSPRSFVNARRISTFGELATSWGRPPVDYYPFFDHCVATKSPAETISQSSCIGDSLLEPPTWLDQRKYHVLTTELGLAYGEHGEIHGTPFVNHVRLGGGWCAQAVCLMATALCQETARGIYGVAEITALASDQDSSVLDLGGMTPDKICNYFKLQSSTGRPQR
jgi:hypothetical protein